MNPDAPRHARDPTTVGAGPPAREAKGQPRVRDEHERTGSRYAQPLGRRGQKGRRMDDYGSDRTPATSSQASWTMSSALGRESFRIPVCRCRTARLAFRNASAARSSASFGIGNSLSVSRTAETARQRPETATPPPNRRAGFEPVMKLEREDARNSTASAISAACAVPPMGKARPSCSLVSPHSVDDALGTGRAGGNAVDPYSCFPNSTAQVRVNDSSAALDALYPDAPATPFDATMLVTLMMLPRPRSSIRARCRPPKSTPHERWCRRWTRTWRRLDRRWESRRSSPRC